MNIQKHTHTTAIRVRYADTDKMGIVYNGNYLTYFEIGRTELLRSMGLAYAELEQQGIQFPVIEAHIEFKAPAYYDEILNVSATCSLQRGILLHISYEIMKDDTLLTIGYTVHPFINTITGKPIRPPRSFMDIWTAQTSALHSTKELRL